MSYQTGTATSPVNLLQTIVTWLVSIGWTQDMSQADAAGWRAHLHKSGNYVNLRAAMNETSPAIWAGGMNGSGYGLCMYTGTGFNGANAWNNQAGGPIGNGQTYTLGVGFSLPSGAIQNYYFFGDATGDNIVLVIEKTPSLYVHMGWGLSLVKAGTWTGGPYFFGTFSGFYTYWGSGPGGNATSSCPGCDGDANSIQNCYIRIDVDTFTGKWIGISTNTAVSQGYTGKLAAGSVMPAFSYSPRTTAPRYSDNWASLPSWQVNQTSSADSRANLLPVHLWAVRDAGQMSLIGWIPNVFSTNGVGNGFANASEYVLGTTTYKMFPNFAVVKQ